MRKKWYIYTMEYYRAGKYNDILKFVGKWMDLENIDGNLNEPHLVLSCSPWDYTPGNQMIDQQDSCHPRIRSPSSYGVHMGVFQPSLILYVWNVSRSVFPDAISIHLCAPTLPAYFNKFIDDTFMNKSFISLYLMGGACDPWEHPASASALKQESNAAYKWSHSGAGTAGATFTQAEHSLISTRGAEGVPVNVTVMLGRSDTRNFWQSRLF